MFSKFPYVSQTPVGVAYTPNSILNLSIPPLPIIPIMNRPKMNSERYATCTAVGWFNNNHYLATLNLATETLHTYAFNTQDHSFTLLQTLNNQNGMQLHWPDALAFSPDGSYLAITNTKQNMCSINMYHIDPQTHLINPVPFQVIRHPHAIFHGVRFSPNSQYMISTTTDSSGLNLIYKLDYEANGAPKFTLSQVVQNPYRLSPLPFKPKAIDFSSDGSLLIICYGVTAGTQSYPSYGALAIHTWDNDTGTIGTQPLCELTGKPELSCPDDVSFSHDALSSFIVVQSQSNDTVVFYSFDKMTNQIDPQFFAFTNPEAQLSFPHGFSLSTDDKYLAVSNYGDDKVTVYSLKS
ncbi:MULTISPECIES: hypothetical protein [Peribacillus]|uniref:hypothetical protein n=1 Tax=Peribacillus TaxID=2675229 RepID=UPI0020402E23|nr:MULTISPECIES: hypothetical protein [Peribacillus]MCM3676446.1 hypothetical protein [Peribacillus simplex]MDQ0883806.1 6-phosphogluconolactonase (cycloisomerase 2 family) [Peribacillus sp. V2I11]